MVNDKKQKGVRIRMWFGSYKQKCQVKTVTSLITNMIQGVREVSATLLTSASVCLILPCVSSAVCVGVCSLQRVNLINNKLSMAFRVFNTR